MSDVLLLVCAVLTMVLLGVGSVDCEEWEDWEPFDFFYVAATATVITAWMTLWGVQR